MHWFCAQREEQWHALEYITHRLVRMNLCFQLMGFVVVESAEKLYGCEAWFCGGQVLAEIVWCWLMWSRFISAMRSTRLPVLVIIITIIIIIIVIRHPTSDTQLGQTNDRLRIETTHLALQTHHHHHHHRHQHDHAALVTQVYLVYSANRSSCIWCLWGLSPAWS